MKKLLILALAMFGSICHGQSLGYTPPANAAFLGTGNPATWSPWTSATGLAPLGYVPPAIGLYCQAAPPNGPWTPCAPGGGGGGGATLPFPGIVCATSATGGTVCTSSQVQSAIGSNVYDPFGAASNLLSSTNVWTGSSNTFNNGIVTNTATQGINTTSGLVNSLNGITSIFAGTNASPTGSPVNSGTLQFLSTFGNGTSTVNHTWLFQDVPGSGTNPNFNLTITPVAASGTGTNTVQFNSNGQFLNSTAATSGVPTNSPCLHFTGAFFTTTSVADDWCIQNTPNIPTLRGGLSFIYSGSATGTVQVPSLQATSALGSATFAAGIGSQGFSVAGSVNSLNGRTLFTSGTNATSTSGNINSSSPQYQASYWNGSAPMNDDWSVTNVLGTGTSPVSTLTYAHTGSAGTATVTMPALSVGSTPSPVCTVANPCGGNINGTTGLLPSARAPVNIANGVEFLGNSIAAGTGATPTTLTYQNRFNALFPVGPAPLNRALAGTVTSDVINFGALALGAGGATPSTGVLQTSSYNSQLFIIQSLENDANFSGAANANQITYTQTLDMALLALTTAPLDQWNQVSGNLWTCTGGITATDNYYGSIPPGVLLTTGNSCSTKITTVAVPGSTVSEPIDLLYDIFSGDTGSGNIVVDGTACTDTITASSTLANSPFRGATFTVTQGYTRTLALARCVPSTTGSHTVTVNSIAGGTNGFGFQAIFTSPVALNGYTAPTAIKIGVMRQQGDANSTNTATYNTLSINDCNQMLADGFRCINSPAREPFITTANLGFMMSSTSAFTAGAIVKTGMSWTAGNATLTVPSGGMDASYKGKTVICINGLTSTTDLFATVIGNASLTTVNVSTTAPSSAPGTTVTGTGTCYFGYNQTVTLGSNNPGLHPDAAGHDALLQGILSVAQPTMQSPNFATLQSFNGGFQANVATSGTNQGITILNANSIVPSTTIPTQGATQWQIFPGGTTNFSSGIGLLGNQTTSTVETFLYSRNNTSVDICDNNVLGSTANNAFRCGFRFLQAIGSAGGLQMPTLSLTAAIGTFSSLRGTGTAPTCTVGAAAGTGATCSLSAASTNVSGQITINTGTSTTASAVLATITWNGTLASAPNTCPLTPLTVNSVGQSNMVYPGIPSTTTETINVAGSAIPASTTYVYGYGPCI